MSRLNFYISLIASLSIGAQAAIGPVTDLHIVNTQLSPDGYKREYVLFISIHFLKRSLSAILPTLQYCRRWGHFPWTYHPRS